MIKVIKQPARVPKGMALPGFFKSPDMLTPAEINEIIILHTFEFTKNTIKLLSLILPIMPVTPLKRTPNTIK